MTTTPTGDDDAVRECGCTSQGDPVGGQAEESPITLETVSGSLEPEIVFEEEAVTHADLERGGQPVLASPVGAWRTTPPGWDPWLSDTQQRGRLQVALCLLLVAPRVALCLALAAVALPLSILLMVVAAPLPDEVVNRPAVRWLLVLPIRWCCRLALLGAGYWSIKHDGDPVARAPLVVSNHSSVGDVLYLVWKLAPSFVAKKEAKRIPYIGQAARFLGCIFVDRTDVASRAKARERIQARASGKASGPPLVIFPEGTTSNGLSLLTFERGAFAGGNPVSPVAISYPKGQHKPDSLFSMETIFSILRPVSRMHVTYLPRYSPSDAEQHDAALYAEHVRVTIARCLDVPLSPLTYRDGLHRFRRERAAPDVVASSLLAAAEGPLPWRLTGCAGPDA